MAGVKISALPAVPSALSTDIFPVVQNGVTSKETVAQLTTLLSTALTGVYVPLAGGTMTGPLILSGDPTLPLGAATKQYVDTIGSGFTVILAAEAATTANLNAVQAGAGVGATLTNNGALAAFAVDGYSANLNDRILVKDQTLPQHNGVYAVTTVGSGAVAWVLTRTTDYDQVAEIYPGTLVAVNNGTVNASTSWLETATVATVDTDPILFTQFTFGPSSFLVAANNLSDLTNVANALVNLGLGVPTGTGNVVRQTSPTLITPTLGVASATSITFSSTSGIIGSTTNDSAAAGSVGEMISNVIAVASSVALVDNINNNVTSIVLTPGDWDVWGNVTFTCAGIPANSIFTSWTNTVSASSVDASLVAQTVQTDTFSALIGHCVPQRRYSVAVNTTVYLSVVADFSGGTVSACGGIYARRRR